MDNQSRDTGNIWHKTLTKDEQNNKHNSETDEQHESYKKKISGGELGNNSSCTTWMILCVQEHLVTVYNTLIN